MEKVKKTHFLKNFSERFLNVFKKVKKKLFFSNLFQTLSKLLDFHLKLKIRQVEKKRVGRKKCDVQISADYKKNAVRVIVEGYWLCSNIYKLHGI